MQENYPLEFLLKDKSRLVCRPVEIKDCKKLEEFFLSVPKMDLQIFRDEVIGEDKVEDWLIRTFKKKLLQLIVLDNDTIIASGTLQPEGVYWDNTAEINIIVTPEQRRKGIGSRLFDLLLYEGLEIGMQKLIIRYASDNKGIISLLNNYGFDTEISLNYRIDDKENKTQKDIIVASLNIQDWKRRFEFYSPASK